MIVEPTNLKPLSFKSLLTISDSSVFAGIWEINSHLFTKGEPSTNFQIYLLNVPNSLRSSMNF